MAVNVGKASKVFATCGTDEKVEFLKKLVNNDPRLEVINYKTQSTFGYVLANMQALRRSSRARRKVSMSSSTLSARTTSTATWRS